MMEDKQLMMSEGQTGITATGDSTNYIDAGVKGDALDGSHLWWFVRCATTLTSANSTATVAVSLVTADDTGFSTNLTTLISTVGVVITTSGVAGYVFVKAPVPVGMRRYTKTTYTIGVQSLTGGAFDSTLVANVDVLLV